MNHPLENKGLVANELKTISLQNITTASITILFGKPWLIVKIKSHLFIHHTSQIDSGVFTIKTINVRKNPENFVNLHH